MTSKSEMKRINALKGLPMNTGTDPKPEEQPQDLSKQKPEETDNLQKSERPADDYMDSHGLDRETHGKKKEEKKEDKK